MRNAHNASEIEIFQNGISVEGCVVVLVHRVSVLAVPLIKNRVKSLAVLSGTALMSQAKIGNSKTEEVAGT